MDTGFYFVCVPGITSGQDLAGYLQPAMLEMFGPQDRQGGGGYSKRTIRDSCTLPWSKEKHRTLGKGKSNSPLLRGGVGVRADTIGCSPWTALLVKPLPWRISGLPTGAQACALERAHRAHTLRRPGQVGTSIETFPEHGSHSHPQMLLIQNGRVLVLLLCPWFYWNRRASVLALGGYAC